jgi:hypothetical protein
MYKDLQGQVLGLNDADFFTKALGIWAGFDQQRNPEPKPKVTLWSVALWPVTLWSEVMVRTSLPAFANIRYLFLGQITFTVIE